MDTITKWMNEFIGVNPKLQFNIFFTIAVSLVSWLVNKILFVSVVKRIKNTQVRYRAKKTYSYFIVFIAIVIIGRVWLLESDSFTTFIGLISAGIAIALKDLIINIAGWVFLIWRRPFEVGDRIELGLHIGDVIDVRIFQFTILEVGNWVDGEQSTGRIVHIPNGKMFSDTLANYSKGFHYIWNELPVLLTFESNWRKAKEILQSIADKDAERLSKAAEKKVKEASWKFMIFYSKLTPTVYTSVKDSGVLLTVRYLCAPRKRRDTAQAFWEDILDEFGSREDIDFAYPTQRFYTQTVNKDIQGINFKD